MMKRKMNGGFTLIELIVVIAILGILAIIAIPRFTGARLNANQSAVISNLRTIQNAAEIYAAQENATINGVTDTNVLTILDSMPKGPGNITYTMEDASGAGTGDAAAVLGTGDADILPATPILNYSGINP